MLIHLSAFEREGRLAKLTDTIDASTFRLGCTPVVNLFRQRAEPLQITHRKTEYPIIPDVRRPGAWRSIRSMPSASWSRMAGRKRRSATAPVRPASRQRQ
ncbi:type VI secretion system baseplate subunit TssF [Edwardsiella anguillarum]|nr:type VI secretion system baseplate subunit TssF [Edwardsiella anguillarum]